MTYSTVQISNTHPSDVIHQAKLALENNEQIELNFISKPAPTEFKKLLLFLKENLPDGRWFLSEKDSIIAGVLFQLNFSRPRRAVIEIANGCNLKCDFCWTHSPFLETPPNPRWLKKTLETNSIYKYLDDLHGFGTVRLVEFCGVGDPLFHPDIWELIKYAKSRGFSLRLSTNGTLLFPQKWDKFCEDPVDELFMNISAGDRETYADIHHVAPHIFDQLILNLKHINENRKMKNQKLSMRWINIITDKNINNIGRIIETGLSVGADYFDFRYVWIHREFQRNIGISKSSLENNQDFLFDIGEQLKRSNLKTNFRDFYHSIYNRETSHA